MLVVLGINLQEYFVMIRKNTFIALTSGLLLLASCDSIVVKDNMNNDQMVAMSFDVQSPSPVDSRATISGNIKGVTSPSVIWEEGDKIKIFEKGHNDGGTFTLTSFGELDNIATFEGYSYTGTEYYSVYPSTTNATYNSSIGLLTFNIPSSQQAKKGTFDPRGAVQLGISNAAGAIDNHHVTAGLYITFDANCTINSVTVQPADSKFTLAGKVTATPANSTFEYTFDKDGDNKVTISNFPNDIAGTYVLSVLPSIENPAINLNISYKNAEGQNKTYTRRFDATSSWMAANLYSLGSYTMSDNTITALNTYLVSYSTGEHGQVIATPNKVEAGHTITLKITPENGYRLGTLTVTDSEGNTVEALQVTGSSDYSFTMPASNVTVTTTFVAQ